MGLDNRIRIIGGRFKGKQLEVLDVEGLRPTTDRARETIFNWLNNKLEGIRVLDLFAGSGALGLEALSRGAHEVTFVEKNRDNATLLKNVVSSLPELDGDKAEVFNIDAERFIREYDRNAEPYDLIFFDPPYDIENFTKIVEDMVNSPLFGEHTLVYVEMHKGKRKPLYGLSMVREGTMGVSHFGLYERSAFL